MAKKKRRKGGGAFGKRAKGSQGAFGLTARMLNALAVWGKQYLTDCLKAGIRIRFEVWWSTCVSPVARQATFLIRVLRIPPAEQDVFLWLIITEEKGHLVVERCNVDRFQDVNGKPWLSPDASFGPKGEMALYIDPVRYAGYLGEIASRPPDLQFVEIPGFFNNHVAEESVISPMVFFGAKRPPLPPSMVRMKVPDDPLHHIPM